MKEEILSGKYNPSQGCSYEILGVAEHTEKNAQYTIFRLLHSSDEKSTPLFAALAKVFSERLMNNDPRIHDLAIDGEILAGRYQHFKGHFYDVLGVAAKVGRRDTTPLVIYRPLYGSEKNKKLLFARPKDMFLETIVDGGRECPRFKYVSP